MHYEDLTMLGYPIARLSYTAQSIEVLRPEIASLIVHVLFIDIVGYSKLSMDEQHKASCALTECVLSIPDYSSAIEGGTLTCLDTGDGMALVFDGDPTIPALAALQIAECRGEDPLRPVRMGLHSGPATRVKDINGKVNYKGVGMNVAQRVMDCARPGQITMTEHYASIMRCYVGWSDRIVSRGLHTVKHGLKLRVCELLYPFAPRQPLREVLRAEIAPINPLIRWLGLCAIISFLFAMVFNEAIDRATRQFDTLWANPVPDWLGPNDPDTIRYRKQAQQERQRQKIADIYRQPVEE